MGEFITLLAGILIAVIASNPFLAQTPNASRANEPANRTDARRNIQHPVDIDRLWADYEKTPDVQLLEILIDAASRPLIGLETADSTGQQHEGEMRTREYRRKTNLQHMTVLSARRSLAYHINYDPYVAKFASARLKKLQRSERVALKDGHYASRS